MGTVSVRVPKDLEQELEAYMEEEKLDRSVAVRKLLAERLEEWEQERAVQLLAAGKISFGKAADMAGMNVWAFTRLLKEKQVPWVDEEGIRKELEQV